MTAKYYVDANMMEALGACDVARRILGDEKVLLNKRTVRNILDNPEIAGYISWPVRALRDRLRKPPQSFSTMHKHMENIAAAAENYAFSCDCKDCAAVSILRKQHFPNGRASPAIVTETLALLEQVGDMWHEQVQR